MEESNSDVYIYLSVDDKSVLGVFQEKSEFNLKGEYFDEENENSYDDRIAKRLENLISPSIAPIERHQIKRSGYEDECFSARLFRIIDTFELPDPIVYRKANLSRKLFSKMRNPNYHPSKTSILALCISLELDVKDANYLLASAGYVLSPALPLDRIIIECMNDNEYDIYTINEILFSHDLPLLGSRD